MPNPMKVIDGPPACYLTDLSLTKRPKVSATNLSLPIDLDSTPQDDEKSSQEEILNLWLINFRRVLKSPDLATKIRVNSFTTKDALHGVAGLYDLALPNMDLETIYASLTEKNAITVLLFRRAQNVLDDMYNSRDILPIVEKQMIKKKKKSENKSDITLESEMETWKAKELEKIGNLLQSEKFTLAASSEPNSSGDMCDVYECPEMESSDFYHIYSDEKSVEDSETSEEEEDEDENEDDEASAATSTSKTDGKPDDEEDEEEEEEDFSEGYHAYLRESLLRRQKRLQLQDKLQSLTQSDLGPENLLVGGLTFEIKYPQAVRERVLHLTFLAIRKSYQRKGLGRQLVQLLKEMGQACDARAIVVHADNGALEFFKAQGFSDDYVLNRQWSEFAEEYTNCVLMTYLPGFSGQGVNNDGDSAWATEDVDHGLDLLRMEREMEAWRKKSEAAHMKQLEAFTRMRNEIVHLKAKISSQDDMLRYLMHELHRTTEEKHRLEREALESRLQQRAGDHNSGCQPARDSAFPEEVPPPVQDMKYTDLIEPPAPGGKQEDEANRQERLLAVSTARSIGDSIHTGPAALAARLLNERPYNPRMTHPVAAPKDTVEMIFLHQVSADFLNDINSDPRVNSQFTVVRVSPATLPSSLVHAFLRQKESEPCYYNRWGKLYYCGRNNATTARLNEIMCSGFAFADLHRGPYGNALHFVHHAATAVGSATHGFLILAEVLLGYVVRGLSARKDPTRCATPSGYQSMLVPSEATVDAMKKKKKIMSDGVNQHEVLEDDEWPDPNTSQSQRGMEYVIHSARQALPIALIEYKVV